MVKPKRDRNLKQIDGKWYIDFTFNKKRYREFGGYTKEQARNTLEIQRAKLRVDKMNKKLGIEKPDIKPDVPFEKFADEYLELHSKQNKRSWRRDEASQKNLKPFFKDKLLQDIGPEDVERYKAKRRAEVSDSTTNREVSYLKSLFNKAVEWGRIKTNPISSVKKLREPNCKERVLTHDEAAALLDKANSQLRPILILALNTAMRKSEILGMRWKNIDFCKGFIFIENSKGGRSRRVPINRLAFETLKEIPRQSEFVFFNPETKTYIKDVKTAFKGACRRAKIKGMRFHDLRHTAATWMIEVGVDIVTVSKILGHSSIQMTMRYAHSGEKTMRFAVEKLEEMYKKTQVKETINSFKVRKKVLDSSSYN